MTVQCRRHHHLKHSEGVTVTHNTDGSYTWTTRFGSTFTTPAPKHPTPVWPPLHHHPSPRPPAPNAQAQPVEDPELDEWDDTEVDEWDDTELDDWNNDELAHLTTWPDDLDQALDRLVNAHHPATPK